MFAEREKRVRGISGLVATAFLAAACSVNGNGGDEGNLTASQPVETTPVTVVNPTPEPVQTPEQKTIDDKAKEAMFSSWVDNTLNSGIQKTKEDFILGSTYVGGEILKVEATNLNDWQNQENLILNGGKSSQVLQVSWAGGSYKHDQSSSTGSASKYFGQIEISNAQITENGTFPISDADKKNGITWHGAFSIGYTERFHSKTYWMAQGTNKRLGEWLTEFDNTDLPEFTPWYQTSYQAEVILQNGNWVIKEEAQYSTRVSSSGLIKGFTVPYDTKEEIPTICGTSCEGDFQTKTVK